MCGRFTLTTNDYDAVAEALDARWAFEPAGLPRYNIAPTDHHIIVQPGAPRRELAPATWGLASGATAAETAHINARAETLHERPAFRDALWAGRCGVVADGFYEWTGPKSQRRPIWFHAPAGVLFVFAGLYRDRVDPVTRVVERRFAIVTTQANPLVQPHHDRMPAILDADGIEVWVSTARPPLPDLQAVLAPADPERLISTEVSPRVNDVSFDDPACIEPAPPPRQQSLF